MKTDIFKIAAIMLVVAGGFVSCGEKNEASEPSPNLKGTKWKLAGIVDIRTGSLKELEPKDCEKCYTLIFDTDSTFRSNSATNSICGSYEINYEAGNVSIYCQTMTEVAPMGDERLYIETLNKAQSFSFGNNELKLYYNGNKNYLLFKPQQP